MPTLQSTSRSIFLGCPTQRRLGWYLPKQERRHPEKSRIITRTKHGATEKRQQNYREAFARLVGPEDRTFLKQAKIAVDEQPTLEKRFREEAEKWDRETAYLSSTPMMVLHDSYQKIMAMGPDVVPLLLRDLQEKRRSWFWALRHLTQASPVRPEDQGNLDKMIAAWVAWGKREGRI